MLPPSLVRARADFGADTEPVAGGETRHVNPKLAAARAVKAWRIERHGGIDALSLGETPAPAPATGEVAVEVHACGINFSDLLMAAGRYQVRPPLPFVPGQKEAAARRAYGRGIVRSARAGCGRGCSAALGRSCMM